MTRISVIVLSYNTCEVTKKCLLLLIETLKKIKQKSQIIIIDNGSHDGSVEILKEFENPKSQTQNLKSRIKIIFNKKNIGYSKANNQALSKVDGKYILFLNSDVMVGKIDFDNVLNYLDQHGEVGVLTVKLVLRNGRIDPASHRGFPTIWNSFCYYFQLERVFGRMDRLFGGYHLSYLDLSKIHEIDSPSGAFFLTRKDILNKVGGFDENFFMYGEDLDLAFRIKKLGYKIIYDPLYQAIHLKHVSGLAKKDHNIQKATKRYFYDAMKIFYKKHYARNHSSLINRFIYTFIDIKQAIT